jgi:hypothetical protein
MRDTDDRVEVLAREMYVARYLDGSVKLHEERAARRRWYLTIREPDRERWRVLARQVHAGIQKGGLALAALEDRVSA